MTTVTFPFKEKDSSNGLDLGMPTTRDAVGNPPVVGDVSDLRLEEVANVRESISSLILAQAKDPKGLLPLISRQSAAFLAAIFEEKSCRPRDTGIFKHICYG